ncbi:MAG: hypothetical protein AAF671_07130, partial [Pseudomonadota bacterium]
MSSYSPSVGPGLDLCRVDDGVSTVAPHRSGRARLTHPAPQLITVAGTVVNSLALGNGYLR